MRFKPVMTQPLEGDPGRLAPQSSGLPSFDDGINTLDQGATDLAYGMTASLIIPARKKLYGEVATRNHQGPIFQGGQVLGAGINLVLGMANPCNLAPIASTGLRALNGAQPAGSALDAVDSYKKGDYGNAALNALNALFSIAQLGRTCFAAGTPLLTPHGPKPIEEFQVDDAIESRHEDDPDGPVVTRRVVNLFKNYSPLLDVHVGDQVIRTTAEHPFWVVGRGWTDAQQLDVGNLLLGADGEHTSVEAIDGPKESAPVYNL